MAVKDTIVQFSWSRISTLYLQIGDTSQKFLKLPSIVNSGVINNLVPSKMPKKPTAWVPISVGTRNITQKYPKISLSSQFQGSLENFLDTTKDSFLF